MVLGSIFVITAEPCISSISKKLYITKATPCISSLWKHFIHVMRDEIQPEG